MALVLQRKKTELIFLTRKYINHEVHFDVVSTKSQPELKYLEFRYEPEIYAALNTAKDNGKKSAT